MEDEQCGGRYGYARGVTLKPCGTLYYDGRKDDMGSVLELTGTDMARLRYEQQMTDDDILRETMKRAVKATRVDFCVNINAGQPVQARDEWRSGNIETRVRRGIYFEPMSESKGDTLRVGSTGASKYVRVYDKAAELKLLNVILTRIEMQATKKSAPLLAREMLMHGVKPAGKKAILQHVNFPRLAWYQDALQGATDALLQLVPREKGNIINWLDNHVGPAIEKALRSGEYTPDITRWLLEMEQRVMEAKRYQGE